MLLLIEWLWHYQIEWQQAPTQTSINVSALFGVDSVNVGVIIDQTNFQLVNSTK